MASPHPPSTALYPLALPINASITPRALAQDTHYRRLPALLTTEVTFLLNAGAQFALNVISSNAMLPQQGGACSVSTTHRWICFLRRQILLQAAAARQAAPLQ